MRDLWLSDEEMQRATGRARPSAQARALQRMGVPFQRRPDGSLLVSRAALESALSGSAIVRHQPANGLNWSRSA
jgi:hypothetical protein